MSEGSAFLDLLSRVRAGDQLPAAAVPKTAAASPAFPKVAGYEVLAELGGGGMGVVYQARQLGADRVVALKMLREGGPAGDPDQERFRGEIAAAARLQHPGIVQIFEVGERQARPFLSLEYVAGGSLAQKLAATPQNPRWVAGLVRDLALAVQAAHAAGVLHRDLKPANVLLTADGRPKVTDFGLAKRVDDDSGRTHHGTILGTPSYMPPEQATGQLKKIGPAADVYGLGAILYECLTGRPPFQGATILETLEQVCTREPVAVRQLQPSVPRDLETICLKCLHKESRKLLRLRRGSGRGLATVPGARAHHGAAGGDDREGGQVGAAAAGGRSAHRRRARRLSWRCSSADWCTTTNSNSPTSWWNKRSGMPIRRTSRRTPFEKLPGRFTMTPKTSRPAARTDKLASEKARESQHILYALQLQEVMAAVHKGDYNQGLALLEDAERCPPVLRDFTWGYYHRWCKRDRRTLFVGAGLSLAVSPDGNTLAVATPDGVQRCTTLPAGDCRRPGQATGPMSAPWPFRPTAGPWPR